MRYKSIPGKDIMGEPLNKGDKVVLFSRHGISYENCTIVERYYDDEKTDLRKAFQINDDMWVFGIGNHEVIKIA